MVGALEKTVTGFGLNLTTKQVLTYNFLASIQSLFESRVTHILHKVRCFEQVYIFHICLIWTDFHESTPVVVPLSHTCNFAAQGKYFQNYLAI